MEDFMLGSRGRGNNEEGGIVTDSQSRKLRPLTFNHVLEAEKEQKNEVRP